jgi:hypothetical protein
MMPSDDPGFQAFFRKVVGSVYAALLAIVIVAVVIALRH